MTRTVMFIHGAWMTPLSWNLRNPSRPPLLLIVGSEDRTVEPSMVGKNFRLARRSPSLTEFHQFPGRCHFLIGQRGWEEVADYTIAFCDRTAAARAPGATSLPGTRPGAVVASKPAAQ
jgi:hypothetical protein